jgi:bifunctional DNA-binding transcriptional regulator/antitoxin component of YhaV-PrlF toxin-antitoxin module
MKATGIVRRIDDLGRVVIPKEIRRTLRIREGDPLASLDRRFIFLQRFFTFFKPLKPAWQLDLKNTEDQQRSYFTNTQKKYLLFPIHITIEIYIFSVLQKRSKSYSVFKVQLNSVLYQKHVCSSPPWWSYNNPCFGENNNMMISRLQTATK